MQQQPRLPLWFLLSNWAVVVAAFALGSYLQSRRTAELPEPQRSALELVYREVLRSHVAPPDEHELLERAISGMVAGLDPYSRYVPPREVGQYEEANTGHYEGIGALFGVVDGAAIVHFPFTGGPAELAGLLPGDRIVAVDGQLLTAVDLPGLRELLRGPAASEVVVRVQRSDGELDLTVQRGGVQRPCVKWVHFADAEYGLGYVYLSDFHPTAARQLTGAIAQLRGQQPLRGLVIDLRFDGGGSLDECLSIARLFLPRGVIATQQRRSGELIATYEAIPDQCLYPDLPLVLLVNERSASASEVLAGALQDHGRAAIVGRRTHGKAYVNTVYTWKGHGFRLKLTTGSYRTPNGRNIERHHRAGDTSADREHGGIEPDVDVPVTEAQQQAILKTLAEVEPPAEHRGAFAAVAARYGLPVPEPPRCASDPQLAAAFAALRTRLAPQSPASGR